MSDAHDNAIEALNEIKRLIDFPVTHGYSVSNQGVYADGHDAPLIHDRAASREALNLIVESLNWRVKKKLLMELVEEGLK